MYHGKFDDKYKQSLLKKLLQCGTKIIKERATQSESDTPSVSLQEQIIQIFSQLLATNYNQNTFKKQILKKKLPSKPNARKIVQKLFIFLYKVEINGKKIDENEIILMSQEILIMVEKLNKRSRFFSFKIHLKNKILQLTNIKKLYFSSNIDKTDKIKDCLNSFLKESVFDPEITISALQTLNKDIAPDPDSYLKNTVFLKSFFDNLYDNLQKYIENEEYEKNSQNTKSQIKIIISEMNMISSQLDNKLDIPEFKYCLELCKNLRYLCKNSKEKFLENEKRRKDEAYSLEGFENFLYLHQSVLHYANAVLTQNQFDKYIINDDILDRYQNIINENDIKILDRKFFEKQIKKIKSDVEKSLKEVTQKSMFGSSSPSSSKVLSKIIGALAGKNLRQRATFKKAFKNANIDMQKASADTILNIVRSNAGTKKFEKHIQDIIKIIQHRNVSINIDYQKLFNKSLDENRNSWKKFQKTVTIKGKNGKTLKAELSSTPASELGVFTHLKKGEGINSNQTNSENAINVWLTEVKSDKGKPLFSGIRFGNTRGKELASKEMVLTAAIQQYGLDALRKSEKNKVWEVKLGNIQLMSPIKIIGDGNLPFKQINTLQNIAKKGPFKIDILDKNGKPKTITLSLINTCLFNFGTNIQHFAFGGLLGAFSYKQNKQSLIDLFGKAVINNLDPQLNNSITDEIFEGEVGKYLDSLNTKIKTSEKSSSVDEYKLKKKKIINLSKQILYIWFHTNGKGKKTNPSAIQTRLAALMYLIEYPVSFNCKSGKDRTGYIAAEINNLILDMEANDGEIPEPFEHLSDDGKYQASNIFDATQPSKITMANTGFAGLKVSYGGAPERMGKMTGASKYAKN